MILRCGPRQYNIKDRRGITYDTFTKRFHLARLEDNLEQACRTLDTMPANKRNRQREKVARLEKQIDRLRLSF